jgi:hypothetical protein
MNPPPINLPELAVIAVPVFFFGVWGWRHGLDAAIVAGLFVLLGRVSADTLAVPIASIINMFEGLVNLITSGKFSRDAMVSTIFAGPAEPLINVKDPNDVLLRWLGTAIFVMIAFIGFQYAVKRFGAKDPLFESLAGFFGAAAVGYLGVTFVVDRHIPFPQNVVIEPSTTPQVNIDAPWIVIAVLVLVVFGVGRAKAGKKKK